METYGRCKHGCSMKACPDCNNIQCDSMIHPTDPNLLGEEKTKNEPKQPTGILKELMELKRYNEDFYGCTFEHIKGNYVLWSDVEAIINKYLNP